MDQWMDVMQSYILLYFYTHRHFKIIQTWPSGRAIFRRQRLYNVAASTHHLVFLRQTQLHCDHLFFRRQHQLSVVGMETVTSKQLYEVPRWGRDTGDGCVVATQDDSTEAI